MRIRERITSRRFVVIASMMTIMVGAAGTWMIFVNQQPEDSTVQQQTQVSTVPQEAPRLSTDKELVGNSIIALVDGKPISAAEILDPYGKVIKKAEEKFPAAVWQSEKRKLIQKDLPTQIDIHLLVAELRRTLSKYRLDQLDKDLDAELEQSRMRMGVTTLSEFEEKLKNNVGISLASWRTHARNQMMASAYLHEQELQAGRKKTRPERDAFKDGLLADLRAKAVIKTIFDEEKNAEPETPRLQ